MRLESIMDDSFWQTGKLELRLRDFLPALMSIFHFLRCLGMV